MSGRVEEIGWRTLSGVMATMQTWADGSRAWGVRGKEEAPPIDERDDRSRVFVVNPKLWPRFEEGATYEFHWVEEDGLGHYIDAVRMQGWKDGPA
jgi:hypothetical protein